MNELTPPSGSDIPDFGPHYLRNAMLGKSPAAFERVEYPLSDRTFGYEASRWNRLGFGENLDEVLPCRRDDCKMRQWCSVKRDGELWPVLYGDRCPDELLFFNQFVESFITGWGRAAGLDSEEARAAGAKMALLELRRARLSMRMRGMWSINPYLEDGSMNPAFLHEMAICGRYMTRMDRELDMIRLQLFGPTWDDEPAQ